MAGVKVEIQFNVTLTQREFSVTTRALAGHELTVADEKLAQELNIRMLQMRRDQVRLYAEQSAHALRFVQAEVERLGGKGDSK